MDQIPSKSISKSILLVTPLFLIVLSVLHSSSELSYLFILKFINNVAGSADITITPTLQPQMSHERFVRQDIISQFMLNLEPTDSSYQSAKIPLVNLKSLENWQKNNTLIKGISSRWIVPARIGSSDAMILVLDIKKEKELGFIGQNVFTTLDSKQIAMQELLASKIDASVGDAIQVSFKPKNILNGLKLFQKYSDLDSDQQYKPPNQDQIQPDVISKMIYKGIKSNTDLQINQQDFNKVFDLVYDSQVTQRYSLRKTYYPEGVYPSVISNVIVMQYEGFINLIFKWAVRTILNALKQQPSIKQLIPDQYQKFIPKSQFQTQFFGPEVKTRLSKFFQQYSLLSVCRLNSREQIYQPDSDQTYEQFAKLLQNVPGDVEIIAIYPFFKQSLAIKYFFDSVIQIFQFVTCIIYYYTMTLIMKQIYQQKQIQVGIWRTLGAGGVSQKKKQSYQVQLRQKEIANKGSGIKYSSQFQQKMSFKQKISFASKLAMKVGFINYWFFTTIFSIIVYISLKTIIYGLICKNLGFSMIKQPMQMVIIIFVSIMTFVGALIYHHIHQIYTNPLSQTIKPVKRTFDVVKVRVIHVATFGISFQILLIAIMLIYYGVVSYYWIPFAVLDGQSDLQVLLFNTIFLFMIFGSIILLSILQSRIQIGIFSVIFKLSHQMKTMKLAILKNIKAKQYKNIKVAIIISIIFAFVLFFTAGIKIQMQIVQSFIERALGSNLVFQNYEKKTFNTQKVNQFLQTKPNIQYSWLSKPLSRDNITIYLLSHITRDRLTPQFQVISSNYLNSTFFEYYYPEDYLSQSSDYTKLPNSLPDGFNSIYAGENGNESIGRYNQNDTISDIDPNHLNLFRDQNAENFNAIVKQAKMAPQQQVINMVVSSMLRKKLGVKVGDYYKMLLRNKANNITYLIRSRITHSFKAGPGFDILWTKAFITEEQAAYIYRILQVPQQKSRQNQKLFIKGKKKDLQGIASGIVQMSPQHTQMFEIQFVSQSFSLLQRFLNAYVVLITCIMSTLVTIFIFLYTLSKCREQAQMFKMLRAIGLSAKNIRIMVFTQIIIRLIVSILNGILLGVVFSIGFSLQIQEFLMIKTPSMDITIVAMIGVVLTIIFSITIVRATSYISKRSVALTNKV